MVMAVQLNRVLAVQLNVVPAVQLNMVLAVQLDMVPAHLSCPHLSNAEIVHVPIGRRKCACTYGTQALSNASTIEGKQCANTRIWVTVKPELTHRQAVFEAL